MALDPTAREPMKANLTIDATPEAQEVLGEIRQLGMQFPMDRNGHVWQYLQCVDGHDEDGIAYYKMRRFCLRCGCGEYLTKNGWDLSQLLPGDGYCAELRGAQ